jgi:23S rRNA pseudouridine2604 synthase
MTEAVRLSKRVVELLRCSRSEADQYIEDGWVSVDGVVVEEPQHRVENEVVTIDPAARLTPAEPATILLHQPPGCDRAAALALLSPSSRWSEDATGIRTLKRHRARLEQVLPLETMASGLTVLTQDRRVLDKMARDGATLEQELIVEVTGDLRAGCLPRLAFGLSFQGRALAPCKVSMQSENKLRFAIKGPLPGQIASMCRDVRLEVVGIKRLRVGRISLAKMPVGAWRYLPVSERF